MEADPVHHGFTIAKTHGAKPKLLDQFDGCLTQTLIVIDHQDQPIGRASMLAIDQRKPQLDVCAISWGAVDAQSAVVIQLMRVRTTG